MENEWYEFAAAEHFWFQWRLMAMLGQARRLHIPLEEELRVLEIGSGSGLLRDQVELSTNWIVDAADLNVYAMEQARQGRGKNLLYDVLDENSSLMGMYDIVMLYDVLEHIEDTRPFLDSAIRHAAPDGLVLINVPALQSFYCDFDKRMGHYRRYSKRSLAAEFDGMGVDIEDTCYWGMSMMPLLVARKLVTSLRRKHSGTIKSGFDFPSFLGPVFRGIFRALGRFETAVISKPVIGTSLLMACRRS